VLLPTEGLLLLRLLLLPVEEASLRASGRVLLAGDLLPAVLRLFLPAVSSFAPLRFSSVRLFAGVLLRLLFVRLFSGVLLRLFSGRAFAGFAALLRVAALLRLRTVFAGGRESWLMRPLRVFFENSRLGGRPLLPGM
jgi:hypothetical protein